jgi:hypothetical protein
MVKESQAIFRDLEKGVTAGIERVAESRNLKDPARTESHAVSRAFVESDGDNCSPYELAQYFRSLSPYRWAQRERR